jgi:hypothetical protein
LAAPPHWRCAGAGKLGIDRRQPAGTGLKQTYRAVDARQHRPDRITRPLLGKFKKNIHAHQ